METNETLRLNCPCCGKLIILDMEEKVAYDFFVYMDKFNLKQRLNNFLHKIETEEDLVDQFTIFRYLKEEFPEYFPFENPYLIE